jgi:hypothetical protein
VLTEALARGDEAKRAFQEMMGVTKSDVAAIKTVRLTFHHQNLRTARITGVPARLHVSGGATSTAC